MNTILATQSQHKHQNAIIVAGLTAASLILYKSFAVRSKGSGENPLPKAPMGVLETMRMLTSPQLPHHFVRIAKELNSWIYELNMPLPGHPKTIVVASVEDYRDILNDKGSQKPLAFYGQLVEISPTRKKSLFAMKADDEWHRRRKGTMPAFSQRHVRRMNDIALKQTDLWIEETLAPMVEKGESIDILYGMLQVILRAFCETAFQYDITDEELDLFLDEWDLVGKEYILKSITNPLRKYFTAFLPERRRAREACVTLYDFFQRIIDNYRSLDDPFEGTVINRIMTNTTFQDDDERASELFLYIVAGHDTTAVTLTWTLMELCRNAEEQTKLRQALSHIDPLDWSKSDILKMVIRESMRLNSVVASSVSREIGRDFVTKKGSYFLPKGSFIFLPSYALGRNTDIFTDADVFRPSRWETATQEMKEAVLPFALGRQNCAGQALATAELHTILARMIKEYDFSLEEEGHGEFHAIWKPVGVRMKATKVTTK